MKIKLTPIKQRFADLSNENERGLFITYFASAAGGLMYTDEFLTEIIVNNNRANPASKPNLTEKEIKLIVAHYFKYSTKVNYGK